MGSTMTTTTPKNDKNVVDLNQTKIEKMKSLRDEVNWEIKEERYELFDKLYPLIENWTGEYPNLRDIFPWTEAIEYVLCDSIERLHHDESRDKAHVFIDFVISTGYKDEPNLDADGKPLLRRTTSVLFAASYMRIFIPKALIEKLFKMYDRCDANYIGETGFTHFHIACKFNCLDIVKKFLELGQVDPNCLAQKSWKRRFDLICADEGTTPLSLALVSEHCTEELVRLLLRRDADPNLADLNGMNPLHHLCRFQFMKSLELLFKVSDEIEQLTVQVDVKNNKGWTPLHYAIVCEMEGKVELLLRRGANPNLAGNKGKTALHFICQSFISDDFVELFFKLNSDMQRVLEIEARDEKGLTPLQWAVASLKPRAVDLLLDRGADLSTFVFFDKSPNAEILWTYLFKNFKYILVPGTLSIIESLENKGYELDRSDSLKIMKSFTKHRVFEKSADLVDFLRGNELWYDEDDFATRAKEITLADEPTSLSLYDLIKLPCEEADGKISYKEYFQLGRSGKKYHSTGKLRENLPPRYHEACELHLSEKLSRRYLRESALYPFSQLIHFRLPIEICEMILDGLTNQDFVNICLAAGVREDGETKVRTNETECGEKVPETAEKDPKGQ